MQFTLFSRKQLWLLLLLTLALLSCSRSSADSGDALSRLCASDAAFTVVFPAANGMESYDVTCSGVKSGSRIELTVLTPARSADVLLRLDPLANTCEIVSPGYDDAIPVDSAAARALLSLFAGLCGAEEPEAGEAVSAFRRSSDGEETLIRFPSSELVLDAGGLPARIVSPDASGRSRVVLIPEYTLIP